MLANTLAALSWLLDRHDGRGEYVLFGSAVLYLHGIRDETSVGDVDVFVSRRLWGAWLADPQFVVLTPRAGDPPLLELPLSQPLHAFYAWTGRDEWITPEECFASAGLVDGWNCSSLAEIHKHKIEAFHRNPGSGDHAKYGRDIAALEARFGTSDTYPDGSIAWPSNY